MSIVYDYLKKIHDQKEPKKAPSVAEVPSAIPPVKKSSVSFLWVKISVGILVCLVLGAGLYVFLPMLGNPAAKSPLAPQILPAAPVQTPDFNFLLEGIIYNPSKPFAIIDGKMYEKGGQFGDFEVTQITPDTVLLKNLKDGTSHTARL